MRVVHDWLQAVGRRQIGTKHETPHWVRRSQIELSGRISAEDYFIRSIWRARLTARFNWRW
jgi:hypothetical protein